MRALMLQFSSFVLGGQSAKALNMQFLLTEWNFVAVAFDQSASAAKLFVNGQSATMNITAAGLGRGTLVLGKNSNLIGFTGSLSGLFAYGDYLDDDAINFLYNYREPNQLLPIAGNAGYAILLGEGFGVVVSDPGYLGGFSAFTLGFWHRVQDPLSAGEVYFVNKSSNAGFEYALSVTAIAFIGLHYYTVYFGDAQGNRLKVLVTKPVTAGSDWTHVAVQWDGAVVYLFLNGTLLGNSSWESNRLPMFLAPVRIGGPQSSMVAFDSFTIWNASLPRSDLRALLSLPNLLDLRLILYFNFNEGGGIACFGSSVVGYLVPLYIASSKYLASSLWSYSGAPLSSSAAVIEDGSTTIALNASSVGGGSLLFEIVQPPVHGVLTISTFANTSGGGLQHPVMVEQRQLLVGNTITSRALLYSPSQGYVGNDSFVYVAKSGRMSSSNMQIVDITVASARRPRP